MRLYGPLQAGYNLLMLINTKQVLQVLAHFSVDSATGLTEQQVLEVRSRDAWLAGGADAQFICYGNCTQSLHWPLVHNHDCYCALKH